MSTDETAVSTDEAAKVQLPRWKCHKEVWAAKILSVEPGPEQCRLGLTVRGDDSEDGSVVVTEAWFEKHAPVAGGYFVQYDDGYKSYSPASAFEAGYTRIGSE